MACPYASTDADQLRSSGQVFLNIWIFWFGTELIFWAKEHFWRILCGKNEDLAAFWLHLTTFQFSGTLCNFMLLRFCGNGNQGFWWFCDSWGAIVWPHESTFFFSSFFILQHIWQYMGSAGAIVWPADWQIPRLLVELAEQQLGICVHFIHTSQ